MLLNLRKSKQTNIDIFHEKKNIEIAKNKTEKKQSKSKQQ